MKNYIVCTSINQPTIAIKKFDSLPGWKLIVVGDLKTPPNYTLENGIYLSPQVQESLYPDLSDLLGWNTIQRRNIGYLYAYANGARIVATVDDDNVPLENWGKDIRIGKENFATEYLSENGVFDPLSPTNYKHLWHRGFPIQLLSERNYSSLEHARITPDIQANFWNGDPDIDAICRMQFQPSCNFTVEPFPFFSKSPAPFNSQNTLLTRQALKEFFLFPFVGRMDDIWASFYVQALNFNVLYDVPTVFQDRNVHDLTEDMKKEYLGYEYNHLILKDLKNDPGSIQKYLPNRSVDAWNLYREIINSY